MNSSLDDAPAAASIAIRHQRIAVNGVLLAVTTVGVGPPLLLLHGWPQTSHAWRKMLPLLARQFSLIVPDMRGCGDSSKPAGGFDKKTVAQDLRDLVLALGHDTVLLVGQDVGGQVGYAYAAQWPDKVSGFVFIESSLPHFGQEKLMDVSAGGSWHFGFNMAGDIAEALVQGRERVLVDWWLRQAPTGAVDPTAIDEEALEVYAQALRQPGGLRSTFGYYRALGQDRLDNELFGRHPLPMPVLAVGTEQGFGDSSYEMMTRAAAQVERLLLPNCGHYVSEEQPVALAAAISRFAARLPAPGELKA
jgi:pimeloyl-ACP methyl ester carboxylesterase